MTGPAVREISGREHGGFGRVFTAFMSQIISRLFTERTEILFAGHTEYPAEEADKLPDGLNRLLGERDHGATIHKRSFLANSTAFSSQTKSRTVHVNFVNTLRTIQTLMDLLPWNTKGETLMNVHAALFSTMNARTTTRSLQIH